MTAWKLSVLLIVSSLPAFAEAVSLETNQGLFRTEILLNNQLALPALIDTGAQSVVVCETAADLLGLVRGPEVELLTMATSMVGRRTSIASLRLGKIEIFDVSALIVPTGPSCDEVVVGLSALRKFTSVTLIGNTLTLIGPERSLMRRKGQPIARDLLLVPNRR